LFAEVQPQVSNEQGIELMGILTRHLVGKLKR
jgi:hypothetical protein